MRNLRIAAAATAAVAVALAAPALARADAVTDWNVIASNAIFAPPAPTAHASTLSFAMVQGAVYDAVNAIDGGYQPYLTKPDATPFASVDAAVARAAYRVLAYLLPAQAASLQATYEAKIAGISEPSRSEGIAVGEAAAAAMIAARTGDGRLPAGTPYPFLLGTGPGEWRVSPPLTSVEPTWWVGGVTTFLVPDAEMLRTDGPPALSSEAYAEDFNEVKSLGSLTSTTRTADETVAAIFWQAQPLALYGGLMRSLSMRFGLTTPENARLFAMVTLAAADGAIGCWNNKYYWRFWRPIDAIRVADTDGNPATEADPNWKPLFDPSTPTVPALTTPNFPEYPSGHSCVSSAIINTLQDFFGTDKIEFEISSSRFPGQPRHFERFSQALKEIIDARVWGGIHFRTADTHGAVIGRKVAQWERQHYFQPVGG
jgi:hypothetical protein